MNKTAEKRYYIDLTKVSSYLVVTKQLRVRVTGTLVELEAAYRKVQMFNSFRGWWGLPFGFVWTPMALAHNRRAMVKLRSLASPQAARDASRTDVDRQSSSTFASAHRPEPAANPVAAAPDWYPDPIGRHELRYWDGRAWTEHVSNAGAVAIDRIYADTSADARAMRTEES